MSLMRRSTMQRWLMTVLFVCSCACWGGCDANCSGKQRLSHTVFSLRMDEGFLISDDFYVTQKSGMQLRDVNVKLTVYGVDGSRRSVKQFWAVWGDAETRHISLSIVDDQTVVNVQRVDFDGECTGYSFGVRWDYHK